MKKYHIVTIGCQMNKSDSERISGYLANLGFVSTNEEQRADLVVVATCGVRQSAEDRIYGLIPKIKKNNPRVKIILTGCLANREDIQKRLGDRIDIWLPIIHLPELDKMLGLKKHSSYKEYLEISPHYNSKLSAYVPIGNGCNNFCAYCFVPYARGREVYRPADEIAAEVRGLAGKGYKEIILIAQNVNSYKSQIPNTKQKINFAELLRVVNDIPGEFWIRFATSHPKDMSDELIKTVAKLDKVCEHIHLPVQAGDDEVLKNMNRKYTVKDYKKLIAKIRKEIPGVAVTTDIIVGFPGESDEQFENSVKLFREAKFDMAYIAQYSPRPHTAAEKIPDNVPKEEKKRREAELMKVLRQAALENNKKYAGQELEVLTESLKGELLIGKTRTGKIVKISPRLGSGQADNGKQKGENEGQFINVKITKALDFGLVGELASK